MGQMISSVRHRLENQVGHRPTQPPGADGNAKQSGRGTTPNARDILQTQQQTHAEYRSSSPQPIPGSVPRVREDVSSYESRTTFRSSFEEEAERGHPRAQRPRAKDSSPRTRMARLMDLRMTAASFSPGSPGETSKRRG